MNKKIICDEALSKYYFLFPLMSASVNFDVGFLKSSAVFDNVVNGENILDIRGSAVKISVIPVFS